MRSSAPGPTVYGRLCVWRDAGVFTALLEGAIAQAARQREVDLSLASVDSTTARAHHDAAGTRIDGDVLDALESAGFLRSSTKQPADPSRSSAD